MCTVVSCVPVSDRGTCVQWLAVYLCQTGVHVYSGSCVPVSDRGTCVQW